jgi:hypothetical protein
MHGLNTINKLNGMSNKQRHEHEEAELQAEIDEIAAQALRARFWAITGTVVIIVGTAFWMV